jgi:hypothetical protein
VSTHFRLEWLLNEFLSVFVRHWWGVKLTLDMAQVVYLQHQQRVKPVSTRP